jgi:hypothetical protein
MKQWVQSALEVQFLRKEFVVNTGYVRNMMKQLTTYSQVVPFWRRMIT